MKVTTIVFGVLVACGVCYAAEHGPLLVALQPQSEYPQQQVELVADPHNRQKRGLLLGAAALGAGALGAGAIGAGVLGAGIIGAKVVGAGLIGGALAAKYAGHGGYGYGHGHGGYGYGRSYRTHYAPVYVVEEHFNM